MLGLKVCTSTLDLLPVTKGDTLLLSKNVVILFMLLVQPECWGLNPILGFTAESLSYIPSSLFSGLFFFPI
ncbi:hypothetical protein I79_019806 [Cricetulus griseus]|uniref:Uncharacterized protein n=1 Tax=Cricetulus griseus TaxID=10029 RepID=G3I8E3_CRIGR|nr:hypothetical protein I79_019806 [Cricetulus griseus]